MHVDIDLSELPLYSIAEMYSLVALCWRTCFDHETGVVYMTRIGKTHSHIRLITHFLIRSCTVLWTHHNYVCSSNSWFLSKFMNNSKLCSDCTLLMLSCENGEKCKDSSHQPWASGMILQCLLLTTDMQLPPPIILYYNYAWHRWYWVRLLYTEQPKSVRGKMFIKVHVCLLAPVQQVGISRMYIIACQAIYE